MTLSVEKMLRIASQNEQRSHEWRICKRGRKSEHNLDKLDAMQNQLSQILHKLE